MFDKDAKRFLDFVRRDIRPDGDTYAILLEGWENEGDGVNARVTFGEMVRDVGWDPSNFAGYDSFLNALLKGSGGLSEAMECFEDLRVRKCYPGVRFFKSALHECAIKGDVKCAEVLWDVITVGKGCNVDTELYNSMILVYCYVREFVLAIRLLDEMVFNGVFPDLQSYNILFKYLLKSRKLDEAILIFGEMVKNEFAPAHANCCLAVKLLLDGGDPYMAIKVWKCMVENYDYGIQEIGNILVNGLRDLKRVPEAVKYAEDMIERRPPWACSKRTDLAKKSFPVLTKPNEDIRLDDSCEDSSSNMSKELNFSSLNNELLLERREQNSGSKLNLKWKFCAFYL